MISWYNLTIQHYNTIFDVPEHVIAAYASAKWKIPFNEAMNKVGADSTFRKRFAASYITEYTKGRITRDGVMRKQRKHRPSVWCYNG